MTNGRYLHRTLLASTFAASVCFWMAFSPAFAQQSAPHDPAEPQQNQPHPKLLPRPTGAIPRQSVDEKSMRALIDQLVSCPPPRRRAPRKTRRQKRRAPPDRPPRPLRPPPLSLPGPTQSAASAAAAITS